LRPPAIAWSEGDWRAGILDCGLRILPNPIKWASLKNTVGVHRFRVHGLLIVDLRLSIVDCFFIVQSSLFNHQSSIINVNPEPVNL
jgi:hypothetical protein